MSPRINLVALSASEVAANEDNYNSSFHNTSEAPNLPPDIPSELPTRFAQHLPLIMSSQNIPPSSLQTISLKPSQSRLLLQASQASLHTRALNRVYLSDLQEDLSPTFSTLIFPAPGLFLRLDACSPKDGEDGTKPLRTVEDIYLRLTTSYRACNSIQRFLDKQGEDKKMLELFFLPFNPSMDTSFEYRVFCAPSQDSYWSPSSLATGKAGSNIEAGTPPSQSQQVSEAVRLSFPKPPRISAISQYRWHKPSFLSPLLPTTSPKFQQTVALITDESLRIHGLIISATLERAQAAQLLEAEKISVLNREQLPTKMGASVNAVASSSKMMMGMDKHGNVEEQDMDQLLFSQGFVFDIRYIPHNPEEEDKKGGLEKAAEVKGRCELIELNTFGTLSACGACLFHWVLDEDILYGLPVLGSGKEITEDEKDSRGEGPIQFRISL